MSNLTDFFPPSGGGGGLTPKFKEFNSSGTFSPSAALVAAGGYVEVFLVGGGGRGNSAVAGGAGGEVIIKSMYITSTSNRSVVIGSGGTTNGADGGNSTFNGITAVGGKGTRYASQENKMGAGWGGNEGESVAGSGVLGYGVGGGTNEAWGVMTAKANSGQGSYIGFNGGSGYCLIKWYE